MCPAGAWLYLPVMKRTSLSPRLGTRTAFVGLLLVGALALAGLLAWQALDAGRAHASVVRNTLSGEARFAAFTYVGNARSLLDQTILRPGLAAAARAGGDVPGSALTLEGLRTAARETAWPHADGVTAVFRVDLAGGGVALDVGADGPAEALRAWLAGPAREGARHGGTAGGEPVMVASPEGGGTLVYRLDAEDRREARLLYGFRLADDGLGVALGHAFTLSPLLPLEPTGGRPNGEVLQVTVTDGAGRPVWRSGPPSPSEWVASDTLGARYGGLRARVTVNPEAASALVLGGAPRSRLSLVLLLLASTVALTAAGFLRLRREAELAWFQADLVSEVSHELRLPLDRIRASSEALLHGRVHTAEERRRSLERIGNESRRLALQVENLFLYARFQGDGAEMDVRETELGHLVDEVAEAGRPLAVSAGSKVEVAVSTGCLVRADRALLRQALLNLLDNGLRCGPAGQTVRLGLEVERSNIRLWVEDQGPGVPREDRARVWDAPVGRAASASRSDIGLAVVRQVAEAHGGRVGVEDGGDGGVRFVVDLPAQVLAGAGPVERSSVRERLRDAAPGTGPSPSPATLREATE